MLWPIALVPAPPAVTVKAPAEVTVPAKLPAVPPEVTVEVCQMGRAVTAELVKLVVLVLVLSASV